MGSVVFPVVPVPALEASNGVGAAGGPGWVHPEVTTGDRGVTWGGDVGGG